MLMRRNSTHTRETINNLSGYTSVEGIGIGSSRNDSNVCFLALITFHHIRSHMLHVSYMLYDSTIWNGRVNKLAKSLFIVLEIIHTHVKYS